MMDTLAFARTLETSGFSRQQAEALADATSQALTGEVATKADIIMLDAKIDALDVKTATKTDIVRLEARIDILDAKIDAMETRLTLKLGGLMLAMVGIGLGAARLLL